MADYQTPGIDNSFVSNGIAGFVGTIITFLLMFVIVKLVRPMRHGHEKVE